MPTARNRKHGLEGVVSKRAASRYRSGPSKAWIKTKNVTESEFVLLGLERDTEGRRGFAAVSRVRRWRVVAGFSYCGVGMPLNQTSLIRRVLVLDFRLQHRLYGA
jgi:ATP-dependent DNA ligase